MMYQVAKRLIDIVMAIVLIILFSPILIISSLLIKLTSPGPIFVEDSTRVGKGQKLFYMFKFRTMIPRARELLRTDPKFRKLYEEYKSNSYKLIKDPRVTKVGAFLRQYSLDELPQAFNVLRGEMSIVGPRAYYPDELEHQQVVYPETKQFVQEILKVKPGITGYWQVTGRSEINFDERVKMDAEYADQKSIIYDILIILRTPWAMISGKGAV